MNIDLTVKRIKELSKNKGYKMKFICSSVNVRDNYFTDCKNKKIIIPNNIIQILSNILETSEDYLMGITDNPLPTTNEIKNLTEHLTKSEQLILNENDEELLRIYHSLSMRGKNELMSAAYELEDIENKKELTRDTESFKAV